MDNTWINIRVGLYHFQSSPDDWFRIARNDCHKGYPNGFFAIYNFFGFRKI